MRRLGQPGHRLQASNPSGNPMLATKPAETGPGSITGSTSGTIPSYSLAAATSDMMWACALATVRVTVASAARGLELWSHLLRAPGGDWQGHAAGGEAALQSAGASAAPKREQPVGSAPPAEPDRKGVV